MRAFYVITGILCFMCSLVSAYNLFVVSKKPLMALLDVFTFGTLTFSGVMCVFRLAML